MKQIHLDILSKLSAEDPETGKYFNSSLCTRKPVGYWTLENCIKDALKYKTRTVWSKSSAGAYQSAYKNGWLELCCKHMISYKPKGYWSVYENCRTEALKYKTRNELRSHGGSAYNSILKNGWILQCTKHMEQQQLRKPRGYWTLERCQEDALLYKTIKEWRENSSGAYNRACKNGWLDICCKHMIKG